MIIKPYSFNGTLLTIAAGSTDYDTSIPRTSNLAQITANINYVKRSGAVPVYAGKDIQPQNIILDIFLQHDTMTLLESINQLFDVKDETPKLFVIQDTEDTTAENPKRYQVYATPKRVIGGGDGNHVTVELAMDDPIWSSVTQNSQSFLITATTDSTSVTNNGNDYAYPVFQITPTSQASTDFIYNSYFQVLPTSTDPWPSRPVFLQPTTDTWDTAALITAGKMQSAGQDIRVMKNGVFIDYQLSGINTTDTKILIVTDMPASITGTLKSAIASSDTITEIELAYTTANLNAITAMPSAGRAVIYATLGLAQEEFTYTAKTITATKLAFTVSNMAVRNTTRQNWSAGNTVAWLPYDFNVLYGNTTVSAYTIDDTRKPIIALTSTNSSFVYTNFFDLAGLRPASFKPSVLSVSNPSASRSGYYTSTNDVSDVDPATAMGVKNYTSVLRGAWVSENMFASWMGYFPDKIASIAADGAIYQVTGSNMYAYILPALTPSLDYVSNAVRLSQQASSDYGTWTTWSKATTDFTFSANTYRYLFFFVRASINGTTDTYQKIEMSGLTVGLSNPPHVMKRSESANYKLDCTIRNETTGESMQIVYPMLLNETLYVDTNPDFPTAKYHGQIVNGAVKLSSTRSAWLKLQPGANSIGFESNLAATSNVSVAIKWYDRMNFL